MKLMKVVVALFTRPKKKPKELDIAKERYSQVLEQSDVTSKEFTVAKDGLIEIKNFEKELKKKPEKNKPSCLDITAIIVALIGVGGQAVCTDMIERYNSAGNMFPTKSQSTQWLGSDRWNPLGVFRGLINRNNRG